MASETITDGARNAIRDGRVILSLEKKVLKRMREFSNDDSIHHSLASKKSRLKDALESHVPGDDTWKKFSVKTLTSIYNELSAARRQVDELLAFHLQLKRDQFFMWNDFKSEAGWMGVLSEKKKDIIRANERHAVSTAPFWRLVVPFFDVILVDDLEFKCKDQLCPPKGLDLDLSEAELAEYFAAPKVAHVFNAILNGELAGQFQLVFVPAFLLYKVRYGSRKLRNIKHKYARVDLNATFRKFRDFDHYFKSVFPEGWKIWDANVFPNQTFAYNRHTIHLNHSQPTYSSHKGHTMIYHKMAFLKWISANQPQ